MATYIVENPQTYHIERSVIEADEREQNRHDAEIQKIHDRRDTAIALHEFCLHERFLAKLARGEFAGNVKALKERIEKHKKRWE